MNNLLDLEFTFGVCNLLSCVLIEILSFGICFFIWPDLRRKRSTLLFSILFYLSVRFLPSFPELVRFHENTHMSDTERNMIASLGDFWLFRQLVACCDFCYKLHIQQQMKWQKFGPIL